jgi:hypothetical protein
MPASNKIHQNKPLENISIAYKNGSYIADQVSPSVMVAHESDEYYVYDKSTLRLPETLRAVGAESHEMDWDVSTASYVLDAHALKHLIPDRQRENADPALDLDVDATELLTDRILFKREKSLLDFIGTDGNWANESSLAAAGTWEKATTAANPILVIDSATTTIVQNTGLRPNTLVMPYAVFQAVKENMNIVDRIKYTSADSVSEAILSKLFNIDKVLVSAAINNSALEGGTASMGYVMTDNTWIGYVERNPGLKKPSAVYTMVKGPTPYEVKKWRVDEREGDMIEVQSKFIHKAVASDCGYLIVNCLS